MSNELIKQLGRAVLETEARAVSDLIARVNDDFVRACDYMLHCQGRVVVIGMGKSGHIGSKIAATLASTGTPAFFVHPGEASHGDLGMITRQDAVLAISNSGETAEILTILPLIKRMGIPLIAMTGKPTSSLAQNANVHIDVSVHQEACPLNLAPTSSTTATLAMGDAMAIALLETRGFTAEDFALSHPGGSLGKRLLLRIRDVMHSGEQLPRVLPTASIDDALAEMTRKGLGMTAIVDANNILLGIYTDGDIRRTLSKLQSSALNSANTPISNVMTTHCKTVGADMLAAEALKLMQDHAINGLLVVDEQQHFIGALNMIDMLRAGIV
ncbi:MAG: KpsF/GutQ family sugar-phosphate isomerase [Gammaproteobacteria bacterium]|nr:KpsF/GutQ family sugar-phosphate isomerase [Gammaproteobacteria bacterium]